MNDSSVSSVRDFFLDKILKNPQHDQPTVIDFCFLKSEFIMSATSLEHPRLARFAPTSFYVKKKLFQSRLYVQTHANRTCIDLQVSGE